MTARNGSIRILFDLHASQTSQSARRGVGRYSTSLFSNVYSQADTREIMALTSGHLLYEPELPFFPLHKVLKMPQLPDWSTNALWEGGEADILNSFAYSSFTAPWRFDVIHVSHAFEREWGALPCIRHKVAGQIISATVYDLIPMVLSDFYFKDNSFKQWYLSRVAWLMNADLLLAISESTREDVIRYLGVPSWRVVNISGGLPLGSLRPTVAVPGEVVRERFGLRRPFVMYTGGDDFRKNLIGAISGFAALPSQIREAYQLAIICEIAASSRESYQQKAAKLGLKPDDVVFTGYVSNEEMTSLYRESSTFIFPSLYEGFGLPIVEAMAQGAAVIGSNNSSIKEIINRQDALFEAENPEDIARVLHKVLVDRDFARNLSEYGLKRAKAFSFESSAQIALEAFDDALARVRSAGVRYAVQGWLPMKKLAYLSPLPPAESGVATYSAAFLPYLARYFNIDVYIDGLASSDNYLNASLRIFNANEFEAVASNYDVILYEFGNSQFHMHMFDLLSRFPGVVTLHDALMGDIALHISTATPDAGYFFREGLYSHGPRFRRLWLDEGTKKQLTTVLPCSKRYLNNAVGVISHSSYNLDLCRANYPEGVRAPYRIVPQAVFAPVPFDGTRRKIILDKLGCPDNAFIIGTFGFVSELKMPDVLLDAFLNSALAKKANVFLFFVGKISADPIGEAIKKAIEANDLNNRIRITGFLEEDAFNEFLQICDVGVQLRRLTRGGTPRGALDVLASGTALVVNQYASYQDYPDGVVIKLSADPDQKEVASALEALYNSPAEVELHKKSGYDYVTKFHNPSKCAAEYAAAIHEFYERYHLESVSTQGRLMAPHLAGCDDGARAAQVTAAWLVNTPKSSFVRPKLIIDASHTSTTDSGTGIARTTKCLIKAAYLSNQVEFEPIAVALKEGVLTSPKEWLNERLNCLVGYEMTPSVEPDLTFTPGDILFMLDSSWHMYDQFFPTFERARRAETEIVTAVYDLLPLTMPEVFLIEGIPWFRNWFQLAVTHSDRLMCISKATMEAARDWVRHNMPERADILKFDYWHLGSDKEARPRMSQRLEKFQNKHFFLMVGTIEPRKNHELICNAVRVLNSQGNDINLCIAGQRGWMVEEFLARLDARRPEDSFVDFIEAPDDQELAWLYTRAKALVYPSRGEGFGLPPIEAAAYNTPVICSDIPVLHEVCGSHAAYIRIDKVVHTADDLSLWLQNDAKGLTISSSQMPRLSWDQSMNQLLKALFRK